MKRHTSLRRRPVNLSNRTHSERTWGERTGRPHSGRSRWAAGASTRRSPIAHRRIATYLRVSAYASLAATCIFRRSAAPTRLRFTSLFARRTLSLRTCSRARFLCAWMAIDFSACECVGYTSPLRTAEALPSTCNLPSMRRCVRARQEPAANLNGCLRASSVCVATGKLVGSSIVFAREAQTRSGASEPGRARGFPSSFSSSSPSQT